MSAEGRDSSERTGASPLCCSRPENAARSWVSVYELRDDARGPALSFGLIRCTPERPDGCCSFSEGAFSSWGEANEAAENMNRQTVRS